MGEEGLGRRMRALMYKYLHAHMHGRALDARRPGPGVMMMRGERAATLAWPRGDLAPGTNSIHERDFKNWCKLYLRSQIAPSCEFQLMMSTKGTVSCTRPPVNFPGSWGSGLISSTVFREHFVCLNANNYPLLSALGICKLSLLNVVCVRF